MTSTHLRLNEILKVNIPAQNLGGTLFAVRDPSSCKLELMSCILLLSFFRIPGNQIDLCSSAITEKGWVFVIKGSFIRQVGSLLRQQPLSKGGIPPSQQGFLQWLQNLPAGVIRQLAGQPKATANLLVATDWKQTCAVLGRWSQGWSWVLLRALGWVLFYSTWTTDVCCDLKKTQQ